MRWWLAGAFVAIAVVTAVLVATVASRQSAEGLKANSEDVAVGKTVAAAFAVEQSLETGNLAQALPLIASRRGLALFVFGRDGRLLTAATSLGIHWQAVPGGPDAVTDALANRRFVQTGHQSGATVAALPLRHTESGRALVAFAPRPAAYSRSLAIFRHEIVRAALWGVLAAAAVGLLAATLVARRLRGIDAAAAAIEEGNFDVELRPWLGDEVGSLALRIDRMRRRLHGSFEQLRNERDRLGRLFEQLHEGVVGVDQELVAQYANATAKRLSTVEVGTVLPEDWGGLRVHDLARGLFRPDATIAEARVETANHRVVSVVGVPAGGSDLAVLVLTDVTEHERRERAEREFVANASHEMRTPVSAIISAVEALQAGAMDSPDDRSAFVDVIERQAARLARLTRSLLLLAKAQTGQGELPLEPVALRPLLEEIAAFSEVPTDVTVEIDCPNGLAALAQRDVVEQVVANLLGNAVRHASSGTVRLTAHAAAQRVVIEVTDDGPGFPVEVGERIFDRFYSGQQGRRDGFGLGLAIVREAVRELGGTIQVESRPGRGTTARVTLAGVPPA